MDPNREAASSGGPGKTTALQKFKIAAKTVMAVNQMRNDVEEKTSLGVLPQLTHFFEKNIVIPVLHDPLTFLGMPKSWRGTIFNW